MLDLVTQLKLYWTSLLGFCNLGVDKIEILYGIYDNWNFLENLFSWSAAGILVNYMTAEDF